MPEALGLLGTLSGNKLMPSVSVNQLCHGNQLLTGRFFFLRKWKILIQNEVLCF